jgi:hypothetical protein
VAAVPGTDFGAPHTLRLSLCSARYHEAIDRLRDYFAAPPPDAPAGAGWRANANGAPHGTTASAPILPPP